MPLRDELARFARRLTGGSAARAEDVVQDAMMKAWQAWPRFVIDGDPHVSARAWLYRIVSNTFTNAYHHDRIRREAMENEREDLMRATFGVDTEPDARDALDEDEVSDEVRRAIAELSPDHRVVVEMAYFRGMGSRAIAAELGIPRNTAMTRLHRARLALAPKLRRFARENYGYDLRRAESGRTDQDTIEATERPQADAGGVDRIVGEDDSCALELAEAAVY